jgi:predicted ATPase
LLRPHFLALLAEALAKTRQTEEGLRLLEEALAAAGHTGERYYQAELYRLKGELLLQQSTRRAFSQAAGAGTVKVEDDPLAFANAERCFDQSIKIAQLQEAKCLELRAVMSMARFYHSQGRRAEALRFLTRIYGKFSEGLDTVDLREAKALLADLS